MHPNKVYPIQEAGKDDFDIKVFLNKSGIFIRISYIALIYRNLFVLGLTFIHFMKKTIVRIGSICLHKNSVQCGNLTKKIDAWRAIINPHIIDSVLFGKRLSDGTG